MTDIHDNSPSLKRAPHSKERPFSLISNELIRNPNLSPKSKWLLAYLLSFSDDWKLNVTFITSSQKIGRDSVYKSLNELIENGYCKKEQYRDEKGRIRKIDYLFSEDPIFKEVLPLPEKPYPDNPYPVKPTQRNNKATKDVCLKRTTSTVPQRENKPSNVGSSSPFDKSQVVAFDPSTYTLRDGRVFSGRMIGALKKRMKNNPQKVQRAIRFYEEWCDADKRIDKTHEIFIQMILNKDLGEKKFNAEVNLMYASLLKGQHPSDIKILKTVVQIRPRDDIGDWNSVKLEIDPKIFAAIMKHHLNWIVNAV